MTKNISVVAGAPSLLSCSVLAYSKWATLYGQGIHMYRYFTPVKCMYIEQITHMMHWHSTFAVVQSRVATNNCKKTWDTRYTSGHFRHSYSQYTFTLLPPYQCCYGFSNDIQSNKQQHWKGERGSEMSLSFRFAFKSAFLDGNPLFRRVSQQFCNCL